MLKNQKLRALAPEIGIGLLLAGIAIEYALNYNILLQAIPPDTTYHIYAAQQMLDGHAIYRDVAIIKAPLADFVTVFALVFGRIIGISDIMSARLMSLLVAVAATLATYWAGRVLFRSRAVGFIAGMLMASWDFFGLRAVTGPEPKVFLIFFSLTAFVFIAQKRWFFAGACAALAFLAWQPGLIVTALTLVVAFFAPRQAEARAPGASWRRRGAVQALHVAAGFAVPMTLVLLYFVWNNAAIAAWNATIGANLVHFTSKQSNVSLPQIIADNFNKMFFVDPVYCFSPSENWLWLAGALGFCGIVASEIATAVRAKRLPISLHRTPFILYTLGFAIFSMFDYDFCPDLIPLMPIVTISTGWLVWQCARAAGTGVNKLLPRIQTRAAQWALTGIAILGLYYVYVWDVRAYTISGANFHDQQYATKVAQKYLGPDDTLLSFGNAIILVELRMTNASKIIHLGSKSGLGVLTFEPGGVQGMVYDLNLKPPKLITLSRDKQFDWAAPFYAWLNEFYEPVETLPRIGMTFYLRKP